VGFAATLADLRESKRDRFAHTLRSLHELAHLTLKVSNQIFVTFSDSMNFVQPLHFD
jgi:hypothetical protein